MQLFLNNWAARLTSPLSSTALVLQIPPEAAALLVGLGSGDHYLLTLAAVDGAGIETAWEIVRATAVVGGSVTLERAQEGTTAAEWPVNSLIEARLTAGALGVIRDTPGPQGPEGIQGPEGQEGPAGPAGPQGASAYAAALTNGFVGTEAEWLASLVGPQGPQGEPGAQGLQGEPGAQGPAGEGLAILGTLAGTGDLPVSGTPGDGYLIDGDLWTWSGSAWVNSGPVRGPQGPAGPTGPVGATGAAGSSAYQIALANGYTGSEAEWLASLQGAAGPQGPQGPQGVAGTQSIIVACSDETTALTAGAAKVTFRMPYAFTLSAVRASLGTAQVSGNIITVDINEAGVSILSTKLTIDNTEKTSTTAAAAAVISDSALANDAEITIDLDQIGDGTAKGLKVTLIGVPA